MDQGATRLARSATSPSGQCISTDWDRTVLRLSTAVTAPEQPEDVHQTSTSSSYSRWLDPDASGLCWKGDLSCPRTAVLPFTDSSGHIDFEGFTVFPDQPFEAVVTRQIAPDSVVSYQILASLNAIQDLFDTATRGSPGLVSFPASHSATPVLVASASPTIKEVFTNEARLIELTKQYLAPTASTDGTERSELESFQFSLTDGEQLEIWLKWIGERDGVDAMKTRLSRANTMPSQQRTSPLAEPWAAETDGV